MEVDERPGSRPVDLVLANFPMQDMYLNIFANNGNIGLKVWKNLLVAVDSNYFPHLFRLNGSYAAARPRTDMTNITPAALGPSLIGASRC